MPTLRVPVSTYRLQFNSSFRFQDARNLVGYLQALGITDLYASPLLQARHGSPHGYDVTDPTRVNPELGGEAGLEALAQGLQQRGMGLLLDIVPNHMAASSENPWWMGVLENGPHSAYASYFDIDWRPPGRALEGRTLLPILARSYAETLEAHELRLQYEEGGFFIHYFDTKLPVAPASYRRILEFRLDALENRLGAEAPALRELKGLLAATARLPGRLSRPAEIPGETRLQREVIKERLWRLYGASPEVHEFLTHNVRRFNGKKGNPASFARLDWLLAEQAYVLSFWRAVNAEINYRRFFAINDLVGVRVEDPLVFDATHAVICRLVANNVVTGLRIDHIDGLQDPLSYLRRLQEHLAPSPSVGVPFGFYVTVEKILAGSENEALPAEWPVAGTTGYDFLNALNSIFVDANGLEALDKTYSRFIGRQVNAAQLVYEKKKQVMETLLAVEMRSLGHHLSLLAEQDRYARELPRQDLERALVEATACFPVYRTYIRSFGLALPERECIKGAIRDARRRMPPLSDSLEFLRQVLTLEEGAHISPEQREARLAFVMRWQQFTGPITAKGFEDCVLYVYNRLLSLSEVGGNPSSPGLSVAAFHDFLSKRQRRWPMTQNTTTTHDVKRSEDVRARINVLSEIPHEWETCLVRWSRFNIDKKQLVEGHPVPVPNEEIHLYQTLLGAWPFEKEQIGVFKDRVRAYMIKATREASVYTKWSLPNAAHERALAEFVDAILEDSSDNLFLKEFGRLQEKVAYYGAFNALSQLVVKIFSPGVPDFYQGSELWDFRLVDPDNRRPVDFETRIRLLGEIKRREPAGLKLIGEMLHNWQDGRIKLYVTYKGLHFRRANAELFREGTYLPLETTGNKKQHVYAAARRRKNAWALLATPRFVTKIQPTGRLAVGRQAWGETAVLLPSRAPLRWFNVFTEETLMASRTGRQPALFAQGIFRSFPVALLAAGSAVSEGQ